MSALVARAPAKINLRLVVLAREDSGFHQIETLFALVDLADEVRLVPGRTGIRLEVVGAQLGDPQENLVTRAVRAWCAEAGVEPGFDITLTKRIPAGAGLGGGSSDAAATLAALDSTARTPLGHERLVRLATGLGSDVPFFLAGAPFALAWGRGERCLRLPPPPDRPLLLGIADPPVETARAYARLEAAPPAPPPEPLPEVGALSSWAGIARVATNDFERVLLPDLPGARRLLEVLRANGAAVAGLTGTGAAVFAVFTDPAACRSAEGAARAALPESRLFATRTAHGAPG